MHRAIYMTNLLRSLISLDYYNFSEPFVRLRSIVNFDCALFPNQFCIKPCSVVRHVCGTWHLHYSRNSDKQ